MLSYLISISSAKAVVRRGSSLAARDCQKDSKNRQKTDKLEDVKGITLRSPVLGTFKGQLSSHKSESRHEPQGDVLKLILTLFCGFCLVQYKLLLRLIGYREITILLRRNGHLSRRKLAEKGTTP